MTTAAYQASSQGALDTRSETSHHATSGGSDPVARDPRAIRILAKSIYRELRQSGQEDRDVMQLVSELLSLLASDVKDRRRRDEATDAAEPSRAR